MELELFENIHEVRILIEVSLYECGCTLFVYKPIYCSCSIYMHPQICGMISAVKDGIIELMNALWGGGFINMSHVKSFHFPQ